MRHALLLLCLMLAPSAVAADSQVAVIARVFGEAQLLTNPTDAMPAATAASKASVVKLDGTYYERTKARPGLKVPNGSVIQTTPTGKAWLIYRNGDSVSIGPNSVYRIEWDGASDTKPVITVLQGFIRAQIVKGGERSGLGVETRTLALGVRGTDFSVTRGGKRPDEVTVLRGEVELVAKTTEQATTPPAKVTVSAGNIAVVTTGQDASPTIERPVPVSREKLLTLQESSYVPPPPSTPGTTDALAPEVADQIAALEKIAATALVDDIRVSDPKLYEALQASPNAGLDAQAINTQAVAATFREAPTAKPEDKAKSDERAEKAFGPTKSDVPAGQDPEPVSLAYSLRGWNFFFRLAGGSYHYRDDKNQQDTQGGVSNPTLNLTWQGDSAWRVFGQYGDTTLSASSERAFGRDFQLSRLRLGTDYQILATRFGLRAGLQVTREELPVHSTRNEAPSRKKSLELLSANFSAYFNISAAARVVSAFEQSLWGDSTALDLKGERVTSMHIAYERDLFSSPWFFRAGIASRSVHTGYDEKDTKGQSLDLSEGGPMIDIGRRL